MLEEWQENLAIMAANRTNGYERVIMHLGDCLWRHRDEICGAHICYLLANASFEPFSPSARLCLIGADHCKYPRTYASPEAIQRMEVYEFARVTGNSQFILLPFQPYKLIYASMLAEAGKINEALRYCQAVLKTLKTAGHAADVCKEAAVALEERLRIHSQGGLTSIVQRFFGNIGLHKMIGPSPPKASDNADINNRPATASSRSSVSLASSASMEPISDNTRRSNMPAKSISEPDFRPAQIVSPAKGMPNRGVFTSFVQRAMGFIKTPSKEAKLGNSNKFRYDETLKRWVEEGAEAQAPDLPLAPPPTANKLVSRVEENGAPISMSPERPQPTPERPQPVVSGIPPMPPSSNQYAARARQNVRSRYVDTFNKGSVTPSKTS
ncbi:protein transport protein SEC16A homolog [Selaginella moellendorffii]|uniref:protein transport protein SEC16A homolog n=1 Tax=Selaginella moellendorffii TaxID=88036 RepID=UPI000D1D10A6|nr:protein transport protein SEC16A homolog [Selaginella moellendorffii]|eukprot:XP_024523188.1 protein transport protein SEC16A homolog [Selaginella moellendorffii]